MMEEIVTTLNAFAELFRRGGKVPWTMFMPLLAIVIGWPLLRIVVPSEREAFMFAFVIAMGLRFVFAADGTIRTLRSQISGRTALIVLLLLGPATLAFLILAAEPVWCQRSLSIYFLIYACLYILDLLNGRFSMVKYFFAAGGPRGAEQMMGRIMAIFCLTLVLLNETLIQQASLALWLIYFGLLPILVQRIQLALIRTVKTACAQGYGRF